MEDAFETAVQRGEIPGVALLAANKTGTLNYARCFGRRGIDPNETPFELNTVIRLASATKLLTSVACMQCVDKGLLKLDEDIGTVLPELAALQVLTGFDEHGEPEFRPPKCKMTLRHLLSHSSGLCYAPMNPLLVQYRKWQGVDLEPNFETVPERFTIPLIFDPGEGWNYSPSIDWAGHALERATGLTLGEYLRRHIFTPLGTQDATFKLQQRPDMLERRATTSDRTEDGVLKASDSEFWHKDYTGDFGGMGCFSSAKAYFKVMKSLLLDDGALLQPKTVNLLFEKQLGEVAEEAMQETFAHKIFGPMMQHLIPLNVRKNHALGGSLMLGDSNHGKRWRRAGTLVWSGMPNVLWSIDREAGICCLYASQVKPPGDPISLRLAELFERTMYERAREAR